MCCCCDTDYNIIRHLAYYSERHLFCCIFDKSDGKCFAILNSQYGKIHATQKNAEHNSILQGSA